MAGSDRWLMPFDQGCSELPRLSSMDMAGFHLKKSWNTLVVDEDAQSLASPA
jgi:hypothetical protein